MIGVEIHNILIRREMLLDIGEQHPDIAIDMAKGFPELLLIDCELWQADAGNAFVHLKEALCKR